MLSVALKEWHLVIAAMLEGSQAILLRKGGILESANQFELEHQRFLFYPTFIHQDPRMVKAAWRHRLVTMATEPDAVEIRGWGQAAEIFEVPGRGPLEALDDLHVWDTPLLDMRFNYRPEKPLYLVVVRAYRLAAPVTLPNTLEYAGCRSWVPLRSGIETVPSVPAMSDDRFAALMRQVQAAMRR